MKIQAISVAFSVFEGYLAAIGLYVDGVRAYSVDFAAFYAQIGIIRV